MAENVPVNPVNFFQMANSNKELTLRWTIFPHPCSVFAKYFANRWVIVQRQVAGHILWNGRKTAQINFFSEEKNVEIVGNFNMNTRHPNTGLRLRLFSRGQAGK